MIFGYTGTPGSGKTYEAVVLILQNLSKGRVVFTNINGLEKPECREAIKAVCGLSELAITRQLQILEPDQIEDFWMHVIPGAMIVIDEVQKYFSSRDWQMEKNKRFGYWASTHRHHGFDVVLITQNAERVDAAVRSLWEWNYVFRKVNFFGGAVQRKYLCYSFAGDEAHGMPLKKEVKTYNPKIFLCYKSYVSDDIEEMNIKKHVNVLKHPVFFAIPIVLGLTLYLVFFKSSFATGDLFGNKKIIDDYQAKQQQQTSKAAPTTTTPLPDAVSVHAPTITRQTDSSGRTLFTNRTASHEKTSS
ncbi:zonular occludens toxin domain-containing protein [Desulfofustis glycolicus]|uniref:Zonular occludens toxin (Zot) n=1 Tax=Desulfofustis glycolicus DSM 9705 TaxID=1121409 RepID=A0A1M5SF74_9BACT|nr:zonular occludens toxin domain-containing protein [Desulfofustis glycolicus]MCB2216115.1 zonular occludens toxin domain-containing protein [Desulfobulbaceae bacterium]SHH37176.1 Zonular occludens toxin (Zot) [Desulfofustis glycolicus DSM 9705]